MPVDIYAKRGPQLQHPAVVELIEPADCWEWSGTKATTGYGVFSYNNVQHYAHRAVWEALVGPIPATHEIDHLCRNRSCVNPDHLEVVTRAENVMRGYSPHAQNGRATKCKHGHALAGDNVVVPKDGRRRCRTCRNERALRQYHKRKGDV